MASGGDFVMLIDDLEPNRSAQAQAVYDRYRLALNEVLPANAKSKAAVHFLVNMLEAYYFADADAVNSVLGSNLQDFDGDVETIRHPKNELKAQNAAFDPHQHGPLIVRRLDVEHVLSRANTCASFRTMFAWAAEATRYTVALPEGRMFEVTEPQLAALRQAM